MAKRRKNGQGSIHQRKDGRWEGRYVIGYDDKGLPKTRNVLAKTKKECEVKLKALKEECDGLAPAKTKPDMCLGDWLDFWYQNYSKPGLRPTTQQKYEGWIYNHISPALGKTPLSKLSQSDLQKFFNDLKKNGRISQTERFGPQMSAHSVRSCYAVCRMALDKAVSEGLIRINPALGCKLPPLSRKEMKVLTKEEIQRFLIQAKEEGMYELFLLELTTGMRRGELLALQWNDIDFKTGKLRISRQVYPVGGELVISEPKTKAANRTVIIPPAIMDVLRSYKKEIFSEWLFPSRIKPEQPLDPTYVRKRLQVILERAGCKKVRFHDLRHTFATMSLEHGMDVKTLSTIIGHVSSSTTLDIYTHVTTDMQKSAAHNIDQGIAKAPVQIKPEETHKSPASSVDFKPYKSPIRRPGTGCISQINDHLWEGRYSPRWIDGKRRSKNVYAHTREECEEKLKKLILQMKAELAELRASQRAVEQSDLAYHS